MAIPNLQDSYKKYCIDIEDENEKEIYEILEELSKRTGKAILDDIFNDLEGYPDLWDRYFTSWGNTEKKRADFLSSIKDSFIFINHSGCYVSKHGQIIIKAEASDIIGYRVDKYGERRPLYSKDISNHKIRKKVSSRENKAVIAGYYRYVHSGQHEIPIIFEVSVERCHCCNRHFVVQFTENLASPGLPPRYCDDCRREKSGEIRSLQRRERKERIIQGINPDVLLELTEDSACATIKDSNHKRVTVPYEKYLAQLLPKKIVGMGGHSEPVRRTCLICGDELPPKSKKNRKTCSAACRQRLSRKNKTKKVGTATG
ncbi:MAG: hypothetical protein APR55_04450 [Methanolinea sp. SDB]|nr:MAG: hypothetical protein APR55_04450 [Methanolinea sp. SDB]